MFFKSHGILHTNIPQVVNNAPLGFRTLLKRQHPLLKLSNSLPRRLLKLLKTLLGINELLLQQSRVVSRNKFHLFRLCRLESRVLQHNPVPRVVVDDARILVGIHDALLKVRHNLVLVPVGKVDVSRVVALTIAISLLQEVNVMHNAEVVGIKDFSDAILRNVGEHIGHEEAELVIDGRHG